MAKHIYFAERRKPPESSLGTWNWKAKSIVAQRSKVNFLLNCLVDVLWNLNLSHLRLSNSDCWSSSIGVWKTKTVAIAEWNTSSISENWSSNSLLLFSLTFTTSFSLGETRDRESKGVLATSFLDSIGDGLHRYFNFLDNRLHHMWGVSEGRAKSIWVSQPPQNDLRVSGDSSKDRTHQQGLHCVDWTSSVRVVKKGEAAGRFYSQ